MFPELLKIGPFTLHTFGVMMALGFLAALMVMRRLSRGTARTDEELSRLLVGLMLGGVVGARLAYVAEHWRSEFAGNWGAILRIDQGGLMFYGGVLGAVVAILLYARRRRENPLAVTDLAAAALPLGHAFGRLGCFLNGCCYGRVSNGALAVRFPEASIAWQEQVLRGNIAPTAHHSLPLLPTQLAEMAANLLLFVALYRLARRRPRTGAVTAAYLLLYPVVRFVMETMRGDQRQSVGPLSIGQAVSVGLFALGICLALYVRRRNFAGGSEA
ncbi:MAG: prolipoprotein diacylglyceryl transferase [Kiritimatiellae bacterium]|nr:prolipoprotein diacylglyceryl transferase [Kiritimatiellia bacterium]